MQLKIPKSAMEGIRRFVSFVSTFLHTHVPIFREEISHTNNPSIEGSAKSVEFNGQAEKSAKRKRENQYRGIRQRGEKWGAEIRVPGSGDRRWLGTFNTAEEAAKAFDAEARRIHGKKAKLNFPDEAPRTSPSPKRSVQTNSQKRIPRASVVQNFSYTSKSEKDCFNTPFPCNGDTGTKSFTPSDNNPVHFNFDQGSNSFDCSDFGGGEQVAKPPIISSVLSGTPEIDDSLYLEVANPSKKLKSSTENLVSAEDNSGKSLSEDHLLAFENQMPYLEGSWEASHDGFLNGEATHDGGNATEPWSLVSES